MGTWGTQRCQGKELGKEPAGIMADWPAPAGALQDRAWAGRDTQICGGQSEPWRQQNRAGHGAVLAEPQASV